MWRCKLYIFQLGVVVTCAYNENNLESQFKNNVDSGLVSLKLLSGSVEFLTTLYSSTGRGTGVNVSS